MSVFPCSQVDASTENFGIRLRLKVGLHLEDEVLWSPPFRDIRKLGLGKVGYGLAMARIIHQLHICVHTLIVNHPFFISNLPIFWTFNGSDYNP